MLSTPQYHLVENLTLRKSLALTIYNQKTQKTKNNFLRPLCSYSLEPTEGAHTHSAHLQILAHCQPREESMDKWTRPYSCSFNPAFTNTSHQWTAFLVNSAHLVRRKTLLINLNTAKRANLTHTKHWPHITLVHPHAYSCFLSLTGLLQNISICSGANHFYRLRMKRRSGLLVRTRNLPLLQQHLLQQSLQFRHLQHHVIGFYHRKPTSQGLTDPIRRQYHEERKRYNFLYLLPFQSLVISAGYIVHPIIQ